MVDRIENGKFKDKPKDQDRFRQHSHIFIWMVARNTKSPNRRKDYYSDTIRMVTRNR